MFKEPSLSRRPPTAVTRFYANLKRDLVVLVASLIGSLAILSVSSAAPNAPPSGPPSAPPTSPHTTARIGTDLELGTTCLPG